MLQASDILIAILTVDRSPEYIHGTLGSLLADPLTRETAGIHLLVGQRDGASLSGRYANEPLIRVHPFDERQEQEASRLSVHRRMCHNYHRCLSLEIGNAKGMLICEDDIFFREGFISKLLATVNEMESDGLNQFFLACYVPYRLADHPTLRRGTYYASYVADWFYGSQCVYYPRCVLPELADRMWRAGVVEGREPADLVVKRFGRDINGIYGTVKCLAQHVGRITTGLGDFHDSSTFDAPFPP